MVIIFGVHFSAPGAESNPIGGLSDLILPTEKQKVQTKSGNKTAFGGRCRSVMVVDLSSNKLFNDLKQPRQGGLDRPGAV
jgi:hypothetical protein